MKTAHIAVAAGLAAALTSAASAQTFLLTERNASTVWEWSTDGSTSSFHSTRANDVDYNPSQGSTYAWVAEHFNDYFGRFVAGSGSGLDTQYNLGEGGRTHYNYPKHIAAYNNEILVTGRNDGTMWRYDGDGNQIGSFATGFGTGQGSATDGSDLFVSVWDSGRGQSWFLQFDSTYNQVGGVIGLPSGLSGNNIFDLAYDAASGNWFGLVTTGEGGTGTNSSTVVEFSMGGSVVNSYTLPFAADGLGTIPAPGALTLAAACLGLTATRRRR